MKKLSMFRCHDLMQIIFKMFCIPSLSLSTQSLCLHPTGIPFEFITQISNQYEKKNQTLKQCFYKIHVNTALSGYCIYYFAISTIKSNVENLHTHYTYLHPVPASVVSFYTVPQFIDQYH